MIITPTAIVGPSGSGKSTSIENLPRDRTAILNTQQKVLPFKLATPFKYNKFIKDKNVFDAEWKAVKASAEYDYIIVEDFSSYLSNVVEFAKKAFSGWDVWNYVYAEVQTFLKELQQVENKFVFVLSLDEILTLENPNGTRRNERRIITAGKQLEKLSIESFFTTVLFTERILDPKTSAFSYNFRTNADATTTAKSPKGMFPQLLVPNDLSGVVKAMKDYWPDIKLPTPISYSEPK